MSLSTRLSKAWNILLGKEVTVTPYDSNEEVLKLKSEIASLKLDLKDSEGKLAKERKRIDSMQSSQSDQVKQRVESQIEDLFDQLATPLSQLRMQSSLMEQGKAVKSSDIMAVAGSFANIVEKAGLEPVGTTGKMLKFDPAIAQSLGSTGSINIGDEVIVKFIGYRYKERVIRKAFVEKVD
jgi:molecular chaperone GrpE (heat shock protein)